MKQPTKEQIIAAAKKYPSSQPILAELWPDAFEDNRVFIKIGQLFKREQYEQAVYSVFRDRKSNCVRLLNITNSSFWSENRNIPIYELKDMNAERLTVSEFRRLTGLTDLSQITRLVYNTENNGFTPIPDPNLF